MLHVSSKTGKISPCRAVKDNCPYKDIHDKFNGHYETIEEIEDYIERKNSNSYESSLNRKKSYTEASLPRSIKESSAYQELLYSSMLPEGEEYTREVIEKYTLKNLDEKISQIASSNFYQHINRINSKDFEDMSPRDILENIRSRYSKVYSSSKIRTPKRLLEDGSNLQESSVAEIDDFMLESCEALARLESDELRAITLWSGDGHLFASKKDILSIDSNSSSDFDQWVKRNQREIVSEVPDKDIDEYISILNKAIQKGEESNSSRILYRGIRDDILSATKNLNEKYEIGKELSLNRITSSTIDPKIALNFGDFILEMKTSKGIGISPISDAGCDELEVLLASDTKFKIIGKKRIYNKDLDKYNTVIELEDIE